MKIYWIHAQAPLRVLALIKHLGVEAELIRIDPVTGGLHTPEYKALNPNRKAPTMVDGDVTLFESSAIMAHICIKAGSDMWPTENLAEQVEVLRWLTWNEGHWVGAVGPYYIEHIVKKTFNMGPPDAAVLEKSAKNFVKYAKVLEAHLADKDFVAADRLTIADFSLASMARYWREAEMPLADFPNITRWLARLEQVPAWKNPWPEEDAA
ncbi:glutathione S-transferase family protein [Sneathiella sp. HT1-7]|jgi:glutathione S-transferase|uniref:glutathione S-transferase family protein n=1 Tax=Sneathiella sp. HT1-7 TaxID=2887192 RepID=UPI001D141DD7|nr:glutathione S-transferase family protein [Sneathiella sp. HT1-7]MCC3304836.1 glutathione S-transferase family protein [Sneathiella sp. HT1-7]